MAYRPQLLATLLAISLVGPSVAASAPCPIAKLVAGGKLARSLFGCVAAAAGDGADVDSTCATRAQARLSATFMKAESGGECLTQNDAATVGSRVGGDVAAIGDSLRPAQTASKCAARKLRAAGRHSYLLVKAEARNKRQPDAARLATDRSHALDRLTTAFATADAGPDCLTSDDAGDVAAAVDALVAHLLGSLFPVCGDGIRAGAEQCDGSDANACEFSECGGDCACRNCTTGPGCGSGVACCDPNDDCIDGPGLFGDSCFTARCPNGDECGTGMQCQNGTCCATAGTYCNFGTRVIPCCTLLGAMCPETAPARCCLLPSWICAGDDSACCSGDCSTTTGRCN